MHDDIEHLVERSLDERAGQLAPGHGSLDDVLVRADRRQQRRRATAVVGSLAVAAIGLVGLSVVQGADEPLSRSDGLDAAFATTAPITVLLADGYQDAYRCTNELDVPVEADDDGAYFATCEHVLLQDGVPVDVVPTTMVVSSTWVECQPWDATGYDVTVTSTTPCGTIPATTVAYCESVDGGVTATVPCVTSPPLPVATTAPVVDQTASTTTTTLTPDGVVYVLVRGDTPFSIATAFGISVDDLERANVDNPAWETFLVGQTLVIPTDG